jgi:tetratricopeptide (TPR) repeat protein
MLGAEDEANLAYALHKVGRNDEACRHALRAIELDPSLSAARTTLAAIEGVLHGYERALARLHDVLALDPGDVAGLALAVAALLKLERAAEALGLAERAVALRPTDGDMLLTLGTCLWQIERFDDALATLRRAAELSSDPALAFVRIGELLSELGRADEASVAIERALALHADLPAAWYTYVALNRFRAGDQVLATMERVLGASPRMSAVDERTIMEFALGRAYECAGETDNAFRHLAEGNRLRRTMLRYDLAADRAQMRGLAAEFSAATLAALAGAGDPSPRPIFVVGIPRSGTTLVEQILASHPKVHAAGEQSAIHALAVEREPLEPARLRALGARYVAQLAGRSARPRVVDKMPSNFAYLGFIRAMLPNAKIVHCRRDPLDTCWSCFATLFTGRQDFTFALDELGSYYAGYRELMAHWRAVIPPDVMLELDYEELVRDLEGSVRRLLAHCGLPWDPRCLRFYDTERPIRTASRLQVRQPIYADSVGRAARYRSHLAPLEAALSAG